MDLFHGVRLSACLIDGEPECSRMLRATCWKGKTCWFQCCWKLFSAGFSAAAGLRTRVQKKGKKKGTEVQKKGRARTRAREHTCWKSARAHLLEEHKKVSR